MNLFPYEPAFRLDRRPDEHRWLVEGLWGEEAVGLIGGEPKCCKSFLALELAVAIASGSPCLRRFGVSRPGRVVLYAAEDALHVVRQRLDAISRIAGWRLADLDVQVITASRLRLDLDEDVARLADTVSTLKPRMLLLDPFVRLHRCDENASSEVVPLLAMLRELQRKHHLAILLVHHAKKGGAGVRAGQALRGSSEFHAWGDSMLYLRRQGERIFMTAEHRAAAGIESVELKLAIDSETVALQIVEPRPASEPPSPSLTPPDRILEALAAASSPLGFGQLSSASKLRKANLCEALKELQRSGQVLKTPDGYVRAVVNSMAASSPTP